MERTMTRQWSSSFPLIICLRLNYCYFFHLFCLHELPIREIRKVCGESVTAEISFHFFHFIILQLDNIIFHSDFLLVDWKLTRSSKTKYPHTPTETRPASARPQNFLVSQIIYFDMTRCKFSPMFCSHSAAQTELLNLWCRSIKSCRLTRQTFIFFSSPSLAETQRDPPLSFNWLKNIYFCKLCKLILRPLELLIFSSVVRE